MERKTPLTAVRAGVIGLIFSSALLVPTTQAQTPAIADAISELGTLNGLALACQQPALSQRAKNAVQTGAAKTRENGERFEEATSRAFLQQGQGQVCPDTPTLRQRIEQAETALAAARKLP